MRREERVTVQGPVKEQQPDGMSHTGGTPRPGGLLRCEALSQPNPTKPQPRRAASICQLTHDPMEQGPTEPHAGRSTFLLSSVQGGC